MMNLIRNQRFAMNLFANAAGFSTNRPSPVFLQGCQSIVDQYDVFLLDQYGVLHDGVQPLPGAKETLEYLLQKNKKLVVLSNASSRATSAISRFRNMGLPDGHTGFITSGETAWNYIYQNYRGKKCSFITWNNYLEDNYLQGLDLQLTSIEEADFVFFHGTQCIATPYLSSQPFIPLSLIMSGKIDQSIIDLLTIAQSRKLPAIVANVDLAAISKGKTYYMPGMMMELYQKLGGKIIAFGKPFQPFFQTGLEIGFSSLTNNSNATNVSTKITDVLQRKELLERAVHVGDSLHHDIAGKLMN
jgi:HAD superfamily hydrolase (TIGR01450 family)